MLEIWTIITSTNSNFQIQLFSFWIQILILDAIPDAIVNGNSAMHFVITMAYHKYSGSENGVVSETTSQKHWGCLIEKPYS